MKRIITLILVMILALSVLTGCAASVPRGLNGIQASKLLLARERLNSGALYGADSIFEAGADDYAKLWQIADENLSTLNLSDEAMTVSLSSLEEGYTLLPADESSTSKDGSYFERNGKTYTWTNFAEYSNSYEYFLNITTSIKDSAEIGASLIDNVKKHVRVVDTLVKYLDTEYYLHVEENSEILISRNGDENRYDICMRYKRSDGANVYELYTRDISSDSNMRSKYIPGEHFYYSYHIDGFEHDFFAENTKGFWEVVGFAGTAPNYQVTGIMLKDDICYDAVYDVRTDAILGMDIISADKSTDILGVREGDLGTEVTLYLQSFDGYSHLELTVDDEGQVSDNYMDENCVIVHLDNDKNQNVYITSGRKSATLVLENGIRLTQNDVFLDGRITGNRNGVNFFNKENENNGYTASITFTVNDLTYNEAIPVIKEFVEYLGLECRRDIDTSLEDVKTAYSEFGQFIKYHEWNDSHINSAEAISQGYKNNDDKFKEFRDMYDAVKDTEVINYNDVGAMSARITFPAISSQSAKNAVLEGNTVTITDLELLIDDTLLFVADEPYVINYALINTNSDTGLIHLETQNQVPTVYGGEGVFKIKSSAIFTLPRVADGEYTLVTYVSTADEGIRSSGYVPVKFTEADETGGDMTSAIINENSEIIITYLKGNEIEVEIAPSENGKHSYSSMRAALEKAAYAYGFADLSTKLEIQAQGGAWSTLTGDEKELNSGVYRLKFLVQNGSKTYEGFVYTNYKAN